MDRVEISSARTAAGRSSSATRNGHRVSSGEALSSNARPRTSSSGNAVVRSSDAARDDRRGSNGEASSSRTLPKTSSPRNIESSPSRTAPRRNNQKLSMGMEREVIHLVKLFSEHYFRLHKQAQIVEMTNAYLEYMRNITETISLNWVTGLFGRHPDFQKWWEEDRPIAETTATAAANPRDEKKRLFRFLRTLSDCIEGEEISTSNVYVVSHTAYARVVERESKTSIPHPKRAKRQDTRELASVLSGFSCSGVRLPPYVTFKRPGQGPGSSNHSATVRTSWNSSGWVDGGFLFDWLKETFERETNPRGNAGTDVPARLVLLDDAKFSINPEFFVACRSKNISLFSFPRESGRIFSPLEGAITAVVDAEYSKYMSKKFRQKGDRFRIEDSRFTKFMSEKLAKSELETVAMRAWIDSCLVPPNAKGLSDLMCADLNTPAPESWGSPRVPPSASRLARPAQTPETSGLEQTPESETDDSDVASSTPGLEEWQDDGEEAVSSDQSPDEDGASSSTSGDEPVRGWKHPVDREDFLKFVRSFSGATSGAKRRRFQDGLMAFFGGYQGLCQDILAKCLNDTPRTPKRPLVPKTPKTSKRRRTG